MSVKVGIVTARFNTEITSKLRAGAESVLRKAGVEFWSLEVPGAIEVPLACQALLDQGCAGVVALGAVIRGETPHFEYVNNSVERALTQLILDYKRPVGFGVLTVESWQQAEERIGGKHGHKGEEAAAAVLEMIELLQSLRTKSPKSNKTNKTNTKRKEAASAKAKKPSPTPSKRPKR